VLVDRNDKHLDSQVMKSDSKNAIKAVNITGTGLVAGRPGEQAEFAIANTGNRDVVVQVTGAVDAFWFTLNST
jgi:hypothetical protein